MSKQSKRSNRRNRPGRVRISQDVGGLKVSVFTSPQIVQGEVTLTNELRLVRSALLYADTVELISPATSMLGTFNPLSQAHEVDAMSLLAHLDDATISRLGVGTPAQTRQVFEVLPKIFALPENLRRQIISADTEAELREKIAEAQEGMKIVGGIASGLLERSGAPDLELAVADGSLVIDDSGYSFEMPTSKQVEWFSERLQHALNNPSATLLLDERTVQHVRDLRMDSPSATENRATRASVGSGLIERLPTFPDARMKDVLEVRDSLSEGRARYRGTVKRLASSLASSALDDSLPADLNEMWRDEVQPVLRDMQHTVKISSLGRDLVGRLATDYKSVVTGGTFYVAIENLSELSFTAAGALSAGANIAWQATAEVLSARGKVRKHELVYLLDVHKGLVGRTI